MRGKSALLYRDTGPPGHRLRIFLNSTYEQICAAAHIRSIATQTRLGPIAATVLLGRVVTAVSSAQLVQERHGFLEVRRVKPLGEPAINRGEELAGLSRLALLLPEAGQAHGSP
jgi:hypothetical protein